MILKSINCNIPTQTEAVDLSKLLPLVIHNTLLPPSLPSNVLNNRSRGTVFKSSLGHLSDCRLVPRHYSCVKLARLLLYVPYPLDSQGLLPSTNTSLHHQQIGISAPSTQPDQSSSSFRSKLAATSLNPSQNLWQINNSGRLLDPAKQANLRTPSNYSRTSNHSLRSLASRPPNSALDFPIRSRIPSRIPSGIPLSIAHTGYYLITHPKTSPF